MARRKALSPDFKDIIENPDKYLGLNFLVCGKTGIGKSSLVNSLVGEEVCPVGDPGRESDDDDSEDENPFKPKTRKLQKATACIKGVPIHIWDSPGLQDGTDNEGAYLQMMYDECKDADLVLYCMDMTTVRWTPPEVKATDLLTQKFGVEFWGKSVLVLTKANTLSPALKEGETEFDYCKRLYRKFVDKFHKQLMDQGVSEEVAKRIPAVAVGRIGHKKEERFLWYVCDRTKKTKERQDFLPEVWVTCFETTSGEGRDKLLDMTGTDRIRLIDAHSEDVQGYRRHMEERRKMDAAVLEYMQKYASLQTWKDLLQSASDFLSLDIWKKSAGPSVPKEISISTPAPTLPSSVNGATPEPTIQPQLTSPEGTKSVQINITGEQLKRVNIKLDFDHKEKSGLKRRLASFVKWAKSKFRFGKK